MHTWQIRKLDSQATNITRVILCFASSAIMLSWLFWHGVRNALLESLKCPWRGSRRVAREGERLNVKMSLCEAWEDGSGPKPALASEGLWAVAVFQDESSGCSAVTLAAHIAAGIQVRLHVRSEAIPGSEKRAQSGLPDRTSPGLREGYKTASFPPLRERQTTLPGVVLRVDMKTRMLALLNVSSRRCLTIATVGAIMREAWGLLNPLHQFVERRRRGKVVPVFEEPVKGLDDNVEPDVASGFFDSRLCERP
jgi:hypothetical protein